MRILKRYESNLKVLYECLEYLQNNPNAWEILHERCCHNVATYVEALGSFMSIFNHMPTELIKADNLISHIDTWKAFKVDWYKQLSCNYNDTWIPISDFRSGEDEMFVDIEDKELPILITKFEGRNDFRNEVACESLVQFINEHKNNMEKGISIYKQTFSEIEIIKAFEAAWNKLDVSLLSNYLAYNFKYTSQWVLEELKSSSEYLTYLESKFLAIRSEDIIVKAKIISDTNGIMITQIDGNEKREAILVIEVQDGLAYRATLCIPEMALLEKKHQNETNMNGNEIEKQLFTENKKKDIVQLQEKSVENNFQDKFIKGQALMHEELPLMEITEEDYVDYINSTYTWYDKLKGLVPIYAIDRHRLSTDGKGVTTLVVFHNCLLRCKYCINPQTWDMIHVTMKLNPQELYEEVRKDNLYFLATGGGITFGGGEPGLYSNFIVKFKNICNPKWKLTIETSLCVKQSHIKELLPVIDYWIIDIKDMDNERYKRYTGRDNSLMKKNLEYLLKNGKAKQIMVRVPYIGGYNTEAHVEENIKLLKELGVVNIERFTYKVPIRRSPELVKPLLGIPQASPNWKPDDSLPF